MPEGPSSQDPSDLVLHEALSASRATFRRLNIIVSYLHFYSFEKNGSKVSMYVISVILGLFQNNKKYTKGYVHFLLIYTKSIDKVI